MDTQNHRLETRENFDEFLHQASQLFDTGETINTDGDPELLEDALNFRFTV